MILMLSSSLKTSVLQRLGPIHVAYPFSPSIWSHQMRSSTAKDSTDRGSLIKEDIRLYRGAPLGHSGVAFQP